MIHTLEAFDAAGTVYAFADLIKAKASMKRDRTIGNPTRAGEMNRFWLVFPDEPGPWAGRSVWVRKRDQAAVTLERARAAWVRIPVLKPVYPFNTGPLPWIHVYPPGQQFGRALRPPTFTDAMRRPRTQADRELWAQQQEGGYEVAPETPDETVKRLGLDATFFNSAHIDAAGLAMVDKAYDPERYTKNHEPSLYKAAAWEVLRQRFAEDIAHLGERVKKL